jgi:orotate phosphoribosyltransferase-like protein
MARTLTADRRALALEARNLRQAGYTQQYISDALRVPRRTVGDWLVYVANSTRGKVAKGRTMATIPDTTTATLSITLFPCRTMTPERSKLANDAVLLRYEGLSEPQIANRLGILQCTIHRWLAHNAVPKPMRNYRAPSLLIGGAA